MRYSELYEDASLVQLTPNLLKRVKATANKISWDIASDLPKGQAFAERIQTLLHDMDVAPTMTVYRAELRQKNEAVTSAGCHWTWDPEQARVYHHDNAYDSAQTNGLDREDFEEIVIEADVAFKDVDWVFTIAANLILPGEREITIRSGAIVHDATVYPSDTGSMQTQQSIMISGFYND